jgi:hypothetical protein
MWIRVEYILVYIDDIPIMKTIQQTYRLKDELGPPKDYLGAKIKTWPIPNETRTVWSMNCIQYIKEAVKNLEQELAKSNHVLHGKPNTPMQPGYRPELDISPVLGPEQANCFQSLIGVLHWAVELG